MCALYEYDIMKSTGKVHFARGTDVPKKYSDSVKGILKKAKTDLKEKEKYGYSREDAVQDFFEAQEKF